MARARKGEAQMFLLAALASDTLHCVPWPFKRDKEGYGQVREGNKISRAHLVMCKMAHGEKPGERYQARHLCGNGSRGCINPKHLAWGTPEENQMDRVEHGTSNRGARNHKNKLTEQQALEIYLRKDERPADLAREYGIVPSTVFAIRDGTSWSWLTGHGAIDPTG